MKLDSKYFDSIRVKSGEAAHKPEPVGACQWAGCAEPGHHKAPQGRGRDGLFFRFCLSHVQQYNKSYNYFDGMSDADVEAFQKSAATGHRPTWAAGANASSQSGPIPGSDPKQRFAERMAARGRRPGERQGGMGQAPYGADSDKPTVGNMARKSLRALNLEERATKVEIKTRFKELVKRHHPDANGGDRSSEDRLREIIVAYNYLKSAGIC
jgi:curved DNA-binding protein CbpA